MPFIVPSPALFPPFVVQKSLAFDPADASALSVQFPGIVLPPSMERAVQKRKVEFLAGRYCAREALRVLLPERADEPIGIGKHREPLWPAGIVGTITHGDSMASVAIAPSTMARGIAVDIERIVTEEAAERLLEQIASREELSRLVRATGWTVALVFTIVFSAKESIFKCLYHEVGRYFDFRDVELTAIDTLAGRFTARLLTELAATLPVGHSVEGRFLRDATTVSTGMIIES